jgi:gamma-glutamyltranspeptidase/glutathione hydrolase
MLRNLPDSMSPVYDLTDNSPRWHDQLNGRTNVELPQPNEYGLDVPGYDNSTVAFLRELGHNITYVNPGGSTSSAIGTLLDGRFLAGAETRRPAAYGAAF